MRGEIRLGVGPMMAVSVMGSFFSQFFDSTAPYSLLVKAGYTAKLIADLQEDEVDAVVLPTKLNLHQSNLSQRPLFEDELGVYASKSNPLASHNGELTSEQLEAAQWIDTAPVSGLFSNEAELLAHLGLTVTPPKLKFSGDLNMAIQVVAQTSALCILPRKLVRHSKTINPSIQELRVKQRLPSRNIALWTRQMDADKPQLADFHARLLRYLEQQGLGGHT